MSVVNDNNMGNKSTKEPTTALSVMPSVPVVVQHDELTLTQHSDDNRGLPRKGKKDKGKGKGMLKSQLSVEDLSLTQHDTILGSKAAAGAGAGGMTRVLTMDSLASTTDAPKGSSNSKARSKKNTITTSDATATTAAAPDAPGGMRRVLTMESFGSYDNVTAEPHAGVSESLLVDVASLKGTTFAGRTKKGYTASNPHKPNQDAFWMLHDPDTSSLVIAVFDGHGQFGHDVSAFSKAYFEQHLPSHAAFVTDLHRAIHDTVEGLERDMLAAPHIDTIFSGTTLTLAVVRGTTVTVANVGDSRAIAGVQVPPKAPGAPTTAKVVQLAVGHKPSLPLPLASPSPTHTPPPGLSLCLPQVLQLTVDHKPELPDEKRRIESSGGRVDMVHGCGRIYLAHEDVPGLAMSRSLGDYVAHSAGVSSTPDIWDYDLSGLLGTGQSGPFRVSLLVATDGVFDMMSNEEAVVTAMEYWAEPDAAVDDILSVTDASWRAKWNIVDDTSVCVVNIERTLAPTS